MIFFSRIESCPRETISTKTAQAQYLPTAATVQDLERCLAVPNFKLKTVGDQSFCSVEPRLWNSLSHSLRAGALACSDATPGTVTALLRLHFLATHFGGLLSDHTQLLPPSVERVVVRKGADSPQGCEHAIKNPPRRLVPGPVPCSINVRKKGCMYACMSMSAFDHNRVTSGSCETDEVGSGETNVVAVSARRYFGNSL